MGLDKTKLPARLIRLVSEADRQRIGLHERPSWLDEVERAPYPGREVETRKFSKTFAKPPKAHGARYSLPVVLAFFAECGLPAPMPEFRFDPERKWRFDFAWMPNLALEVQGGLFSAGAHVRGAALLREYEKLNAAAVAGYRVIFVTPEDLCTQDTAQLIRRALKAP